MWFNYFNLFVTMHFLVDKCHKLWIITITKLKIHLYKTYPLICNVAQQSYILQLKQDLTTWSIGTAAQPYYWRFLTGRLSWVDRQKVTSDAYLWVLPWCVIQLGLSGGPSVAWSQLELLCHDCTGHRGNTAAAAHWTGKDQKEFSGYKSKLQSNCSICIEILT